MGSKIRYCLLFLVLIQFAGIAQESSGPPKKEQSVKSKRKQHQEDRKKWKEDRRNKRLEEKKIRDHHKRIQTKEVRKRMKRHKVKAQRNHDHQREPWFRRVFQKKRTKGTKQPAEKTRPVPQN